MGQIYKGFHAAPDQRFTARTTLATSRNLLSLWGAKEGPAATGGPSCAIRSLWSRPLPSVRPHVFFAINGCGYSCMMSHLVKAHSLPN